MSCPVLTPSPPQKNANFIWELDCRHLVERAHPPVPDPEPGQPEVDGSSVPLRVRLAQVDAVAERRDVLAAVGLAKQVQVPDYKENMIFFSIIAIFTE